MGPFFLRRIRRWRSRLDPALREALLTIPLSHHPAPATAPIAWRAPPARGRPGGEDAEVALRHAAGGEAAFELGSAGGALERRDPRHRRDHVALGLTDEARVAVRDHLGHRAAATGDDRGPARERLDQHETERLGPVDREDQRQRLAEERLLRAVVHLAEELDEGMVEEGPH